MTTARYVFAALVAVLWTAWCVRLSHRVGFAALFVAAVVLIAVLFIPMCLVVGKLHGVCP